MKQYTLTNDQISALCLSLSLLLHAGVDTGGALSLQAEEESDPELRQLLTRLSAQMDDGSSMASAFRQAACFPDYMCSLVDVGEQTGRTEEALRSLAQYYENRARLDRQLRSALLYPAVLLLIMLAVIVVLLTQVLPMFNSVYARLGGQLTGVAGGLLSLGQLLDRSMPLLCVLLAVTLVVFAVFAASPRFRSRLLALWRRSRFADSGLSRKLNTARFAQALSMALNSGMSIESSISLAAAILADFPAAQLRCGDCKARLEQGDSLARAMGESGLLPRSDCRLLHLGIHSGAGDTVMTQITQRLSQEGEDALENRINQVEPALVALCSILVGLILLSVMLPLMHIMTAIG